MWQAVLVGLVWGSTNPLIARGARIAHRRAAKWHTGVRTLDGLLQHVTEPAWALPQLLNLAGSLAFAALLGAGDISVVAPVANGVSLAATAVGDHLLGDRMRPGAGLPGLALVWLGVTLCTLR